MHDSFAPVIRHFTEASTEELSAHLARVSPRPDGHEALLIRAAAEEALQANARLKLNRVLLLELHAAKLTGQLTAADDAGRFGQFLSHALTPEFAEHLDRHYRLLRPRLQRMLDRQCGAIKTLIDRLADDRERLAPLFGRSPGRLTGLTLGRGDLHAGGQAVARLSFEHGEVMYKPRSLRIDARLDAFLGRLFGETPTRIRVPQVLDRGGYGWAAFAAHRYCAGEDELHAFYRGLGHWLAVLRLLGGTDVHLENLIAAGPVPVIVDVESLFALLPPSAPSNYGEAYDLAQGLIRGSVLRTGIVPVRSPALGLENVDVSAAGALPGEQPSIRAPVIAGEGSTDARVEVVEVEVSPSQNLPSPRPELSRYWNDISDAFLETTRRLRRLDADGGLVPLLESFLDCEVRDIRRPTSAYVEIGRMLWHPTSLHDEAKAIARARDLFERHAAVVPLAPSAPAEIAGEIEDLRHGDVPIFATPLDRERIAAALDNWREMRIDVEEMAIRSALVVTELNRRSHEPQGSDSRFYFARHPHADRLDARRRKLAADAVERLIALAVRGKDGSVTWITPEASREGWHVEPLQADVYFGLGGVVAALAAYSREVDEERMDDVPGIAGTLEGALQVLNAIALDEKPHGAGGFTGYGGHIWSWLTLHGLLRRPEPFANALTYAKALESQGFAADSYLDIVDGSSGAIVPLLGLAEATGDPRWLALAVRAGRQLESAATRDECGAHWPARGHAQPIGGFAHGGAGIAWALARLALALAEAGDRAGSERFNTLAGEAWQFQDSLFDESIGNWRQHASGSGKVHTWCGGSIGIGLAAADLFARGGDPRHLRDLRRAVVASKDQWGISHTLCHGDLSLWELLVRASTLDGETPQAAREAATAQVLSAIEEHHGMVGGMTREAFTPGLMTGLSGVIHTLCRMHPDCGLASPLLFECGIHAAERQYDSPTRTMPRHASAGR